jgi:hypothetical protein
MKKKNASNRLNRILNLLSFLLVPALILPTALVAFAQAACPNKEASTTNAKVPCHNAACTEAKSGNCSYSKADFLIYCNCRSEKKCVGTGNELNNIEITNYSNGSCANGACTGGTNSVSGSNKAKENETQNCGS